MTDAFDQAAAAALAEDAPSGVMPKVNPTAAVSHPVSAGITPRVVDVFHGDVFFAEVHRTDPVADFLSLKQFGVWGLIHKATQGIGENDPKYASRTRSARLGGMLTGGYHFNTGDTIPGQVNHFFDAVQPDAQALMALDFEDNRASQMTLQMAIEFLQLAKERLKRPLWLYSGNRIKELAVDPSTEIRATLAECKFWLCEYGPVARMTDSTGKPLPWAKPTCWQFTGDGIGPSPHSFPAIVTQGIDINSYAGSIDQLKQDWVS